MRLIDADALLEKSWDVDCRCGYVQVIDVGDIDEAPTIDAVPVVRCKDCKQHRPRTATVVVRNGERTRYCTCDKFGRSVLDNDFCSYGERKDGAEDG